MIASPRVHKIPALQSVCSRQCVGCGRPATAYCSGCGVTPYCGERCQRRDWPERHRAVCHNLARLSGDKGCDMENEGVDTTLPPAPALRPPHASTQRPLKREDDSNSGSDKNARGKANNKPNFNKGSPRHFMNKRPQPELRRPHPKQDTTPDQEEDWGPTKPNSTPTAPPKNEAKPAFKNLPSQTKPVMKEPAVPTPEPAREVNAVVAPQAAKTSVRPPMASVSDVTPTRNLVPKQYLIETLKIGDSAVLSVDAEASACRSKLDGYVCLSMSERHEADYEQLCDKFGQACEASAGEYKPVPGETCAYFEPSDAGWYRARCLAPATLALLDGSRVVTSAAAPKCRRLPPHYEAAPEFCCLLRADCVQVGVNVTCKLLSKTAEGYRVSIEDNESGSRLGEGEILRWLPAVDYTAVKPMIPEISRPEVSHGSRVILVHATHMDKTFVRAADIEAQSKYDDVLQQVALCGRAASPLQEPPTMGDTVLGQFEDGLHYRALCKRTNIKQNKYLLEYSEFGNVEISPLEKLFPCPAHLSLSAVPTLVSHVKFYDSDTVFTAPALEYVELLKDNSEELILTLPGGAKSAASGAVVTLTVAKNKDNVNKKLADMCTTGWKRLEEQGGDVVDTEPLMYSDVEYLELPGHGCEVEVLDVSMLEGGVVSACQRGLPHADYVLNQLTQQMAEYCNSELGRRPYLPKPEELCIAQFPPYPQWFRAVVAEQIAGAGGETVRLCYLDYGNMGVVPVSALRKMMPDFLAGLPVLATHLEIRDFPKDLTPEMLKRAAEYMQINEEGRGVLRVSRCEPQEPGMYLVDAPGLIAAMTGN